MYIRQGKPEQAKRSKAWQIATGLQWVDGLSVSSYLQYTAKAHIEGKITIKDAQRRIMKKYHEEKIEDDTMEADLVSSRIVEILLSDIHFEFSSVEFLHIHKQLFSDILLRAGKVRTYNIAKNEWVLKGDTVIYTSWSRIRDTLEYDFQTEIQYSYDGMNSVEMIRHLAKFTADLWQIHPFCEGNTRTTAVFLLGYVKSLGMNISYQAFLDHSWYFRNALVRANYNDYQERIFAKTKYLELFLSNLLLGANYELNNQYLHLDYMQRI